MLRLGLCALLVSAVALPASAQQNNTPAAGTAGMSVGFGAQGAWGGQFTGWGPGSRYSAPELMLEAMPNQLQVGDVVRSAYGGVIGRIAYADGNVAVVKSSHWAMRLPVKAFGVDHQGLVIKLSPASFDYLARGHGVRIG